MEPKRSEAGRVAFLMKRKLSCPQCQSTEISQTLLGVPWPDKTNRARCLSCGWVGTPFDAHAAADQGVIQLAAGRAVALKGKDAPR